MIFFSELWWFLRWGQTLCSTLSWVMSRLLSQWFCLSHELIRIHVCKLILSHELIRIHVFKKSAWVRVNRFNLKLPSWIMSHSRWHRCERFERASFERESFERTMFSACHFSDMTFERLSNTAIFNVGESRVSAKPISATTIWATVHPSEIHFPPLQYICHETGSLQIA